jgi:ABC-2 type transport system permease protein
MTTTLTETPAPPAGEHGSWPGVLRSEWTKIRSVRSTYWTLAGSVLAIVGLGALFCLFYVLRFSHLGPGEFAGAWHRSIRGVFLAQLAIGVLGILAMTGEFGTGAIRSSFAAVPQRSRVLVAKGAVFAAVTLVISMIAAFAAFFIGQAILDSKHAGATIGAPGVAQAVVGVGLYLTVLSLFALALGTILRHTAGAIASLFGILLVLPVLASALPSPWDADVAKYLPGDAGLALADLSLGPGSLSPWIGFAVFCAWTVALLALAGWLLDRRDV